MFISKKISALLIIVALSTGLSSGLGAVSAQDKKKIAERKAKRAKEKTKGKAKAKSSKKSSTAKKSKASEVKKLPVVKQASVVKPTSKKPVIIKSQPTKKTEKAVVAMPVIDIDTPPSDMPAKLSVALIAMLPDNVKNRVDNIILSFSSNAEVMFKNIYLLCWIDDELMKLFNSSDFYSTLLTVISQESDVSYASVEAMATATKDKIDSVLVRFENAITTGDMANFDIQQVQDLFRGTDSYSEYLDRSLRLATEYKQSNMITVLKLALANAGSAFDVSEQEDFNY